MIRNKRIEIGFLAVLLSVISTRAFAQSDPFVPVPDGVGSAVRGGFNARLGGTSPILPKLVSVAFASFGTEVDRQLRYCSDRQATIPCTGGGTGAFAYGSNGQWLCAAPGVAMTANAILPMKLNRTDYLGGFNGARSGEMNAQDQGAVSGSTTTTTANCNSGSNILVLGSASGWTMGMGIKVSGCGPATSLSTPAQPTATATCGGTCTSSYAYEFLALDGLGGYPGPSAASSNVSNNATLDRVNNFNTVCETAVAEVFSYEVFRGSTPIAFVHSSVSATGNTTVCVKDYGQSLGLSGTPDAPTTLPGAGHNDALDTAITALNGTSATVALSASSTVSSAIAMHDDAVLIRGAADGLPYPNGGRVFMPGLTWVINSPIVVGSPGNTEDPHGYQFMGAGEYQAILQTGVGLAGLPVFKSVNGDHFLWEDFAVAGNASAPFLFAVESNRNNPDAAGPAVGYHKIHRVNVGSIRNQAPNSGVYGFGFTAATGWDNNNESNTIATAIPTI